MHDSLFFLWMKKRLSVLRNTKKLIAFVLSAYSKDMQSVFVVFRDKVSSKKTLDGFIGWGFMGCASHRCNQAVCDIISEHREMVAIVDNIISELHQVITSGKIRHFPSLKPVLSNLARRSSIYVMLLRYEQPKEFIPKLGIHDTSLHRLAMLKI